MTKKNANETTAPVETPAPPRVALLACASRNDYLELQFQATTIANPTALLARLLAEEMPRWKETAPEWQRIQPFLEHLAEARRDLANAEAGADAAKDAWQQALRSGGDAASLERNYKDGLRAVDVIRERESVLKAKETELRSAVETAWRRRIAELLAGLRSRSEQRVREAREAIVSDPIVQKAAHTIVEETNLCTRLALGDVGVFGLGPPLF